MNTLLCRSTPSAFVALIFSGFLMVNQPANAQAPSPSDSARVHQLFSLAQKCSVDSSLAYLDTALEISSRKNMEQLLARTYHKIGTAYRSVSIYEKALENYFNGLKIAESIQDSIRITDIYSSIGNVYLVTRELDDALDYFEKSRNLSQQINDSIGVMISYINTGAAHQKKQNLDTALKYYRSALITAEAKNYKKDEAILNGNIGSTYMVKGVLDSAELYLKRTLALKEEIGDALSIAHTLIDLSDLMVDLNQPEKGVAYAQRAITLSQSANSGRYLKFGYLALSENQSLLGEFEAAFENLKIYNQLNDSLFGAEKAEQFKELQVKYQTEKKDEAILSLEREQEIARFRTRIYLFIGFLIFIIAAIVLFWQWQRARKNRELLEKEKEVDRLKADFFANISHEFRTPLTLILSPLHTLLEKEEDAEKRKLLLNLDKNAGRLLNLINQILDLSQIEAGQFNLQAEKINLTDLSKGITMSFESLAKSKNIELIYSSAEEEIDIYLDVAQFEIILINLLSNALKFTPTNGQVKVEISKEYEVPELQNAKGIKLQVIDNGGGIPTEKIPFIFDRYYQAENANTEVIGSGIGLALAKELVLMHEGSITVESNPGAGTVFTILLRTGKEHLSTSQFAGDNKFTNRETPLAPDFLQEESLNSSLDGDNKKPVLLLTEDNFDVREYVKSILSEDYQIIEAENGKRGVELAEEFIPDIIISDVMMPEMNGYDLCKSLKQNPKTSHIPIILLTAKASTASRITGLETEADIYLSKPFVPRELQLSAKNLINSRKKLRAKFKRGIHFEPAEIAVNSVDEQFLEKVQKAVAENYTSADFTVEKLCKHVGMSRSQLHRKLHALTNESASGFIRSYRLQVAKQLLESNSGTVSEICYQVGFNSPSYFTKCFTEAFGNKPSEIKIG